MTIAGRINALVIAITLTLGVMITVFTAVREYRGERELLVDNLVSLVPGQPDLQVYIYYREMNRLNRALDRFFRTKVFPDTWEPEAS